MNRFILSLLAVPVLVAAAAAHPLPNMRFDRTLYVRVAPGVVSVRYDLDINEWTMVLDGKNLVTKDDLASASTPRKYAEVYAKKKAVLVADALRATVDKADLTFRVEKAEVVPERDHLQFRFEFLASYPGGRLNTERVFRFEDQNFEDRSGVVTLYLDRSGDSVAFLSSEEPVDLRGKSPLEYKPGDEKRARKASAVFALTATGGLTGMMLTPPLPPPPPPPVPSEGQAPGFVFKEKTLFEQVRDRGLVALFDTDVGLGLLLVLSGLFGMAHAFTPGHGKTMVAAYLVGERGTVKHAVVLGLVTTIAHTGGVIALGVVLYAAWGNRPPTEAQGWITLAGGLLIAFVGMWMFLMRVRGKADHVHLFGGHHHHHDHGDGHTHSHAHAHDHSHDHDHDHHHHHPVEAKTSFGWARVILLGLGGGMIPCYDAVLMFIVALNLGRVGLAIPLLIAFSLGLALVLVLLGVGVVYANRAGGRRFAERRWFRALPVLSAAVLIGLGVWFARDGWQMIIDP
jgi:ABC-type nickel/cobalt efflux system permease component RcnA